MKNRKRNLCRAAPTISIINRESCNSARWMIANASEAIKGLILVPNPGPGMEILYIDEATNRSLYW